MTKLCDKPTGTIKDSFEEIQPVRFVKRSGYCYKVSFNKPMKTDEPRRSRSSSFQALSKHKDCYISIHQALSNSTNHYRLIFTASYLAARSQSVEQQQQAQEEDSTALSLFFNLILKDIQNDISTLEPYTEEMSAEDDELLAGVVVDP